MFQMTKSVLLAMLAATAGTSSVSAEPLTRIVGGKQASPGEYPYFVEMGGVGCGGALIAPDVALFAAHCGDWKDEQINIGAYKSETLLEGAQERFCDEWIPDPKYGTEGSDINYDFALCRLNKPVTIDTSFVTLELNEEDSVPAAGENLDVMGLGALSQGGAAPQYLHEVTVPAIDNDVCNRRDYYDGEITDIMLCAGFPESGGKDSCQGDSGGPIIQRVQRNGKNVHLHVGVVSWGYGCAQANYPGVYARTSKRADWIKSTACNQFNSIASFCDNDPPPTPPSCGNELKVQVTTDRYAYETEWTLTDSGDNQVFARKYLIQNHQNDHTICLKANECYSWAIDDFDGIPEGSYFLYVNGKEVASGNGNFRGTKKESFCTGDDVANPTAAPVPSPTPVPTNAPVPSPTPIPTNAPVPSPTAAPTNAPIPSPTAAPTNAPIPSPTAAPTRAPIPSPTAAPTRAPIPSPTAAPTEAPFSYQTDRPTITTTDVGTIWNSQFGTIWNSQFSSDEDTYDFSTEPPTAFPTFSPTASPTDFPTMSPTDAGICEDSETFRFKNKKKKTCNWVGKGDADKVLKKCKKKWQNLRVYDWCPQTCGLKVGLGPCA